MLASRSLPIALALATWAGGALAAVSAPAVGEATQNDPAGNRYSPPAPPPIASPISDHFALTGIYLLGHVSTDARIDPGNGIPGTAFTAEHALGLTDQADQFRIEIMVRLEERSRLRVDFFDLRRNGATVLDSTLQYGDQTFVNGDRVQSAFNWRQMDITYTYSFLRFEHFELGAGAGVHLIEADAQAEVPGTPNRVDYSGAGPFATIALDGTWLVARRWALSARAQYLNVSVGSLSGTLGDYHADVQYRWQRNMAFGLGYEHSVDQLQVRNENPSGVLRLTISGPEAFVRVSF
jgi:hypothetical protein